MNTFIEANWSATSSLMMPLIKVVILVPFFRQLVNSMFTQRNEGNFELQLYVFLYVETLFWHTHNDEHLFNSKKCLDLAYIPTTLNNRPMGNDVCMWSFFQVFLVTVVVVVVHFTIKYNITTTNTTMLMMMMMFNDDCVAKM